MNERFVWISVFASACLVAACSGKVVNEEPGDTGGTGGTGGTQATGGTGETGGTGGTTGGTGGTGGPSTGGTGAVGGTGGTSTGGVGGTCVDCASPPPADPSAPAGDGQVMTFAMKHVYLGDTSVQGTPSATAWKSFGYDIDGQKSDKNSSYHCRVQSGGRDEVEHPDRRR